jgi:hypothetical protein
MSPNTQILSLTLPVDVLELYEAEAKEKGLTLDEVVTKRLFLCRQHSANRGVYFNDKERSELEKLTGGRIVYEAEDALKRIRNQLSIRLGNTQVILAPTLLTRLKSRCSRAMDFKQYLRKQAIEGLERAANMR